MHHLTGEIRDRHVMTFRKRLDYLERITKELPTAERFFQVREIHAIRALLLCAKKVEGESGAET